MDASFNIKYLTMLLEKDKLFLESKFKEIKQFATICCDCGRNTFVGSYPSWHSYKRSLCSDCGKKYIEFLKHIEAWDN